VGPRMVVRQEPMPDDVTHLAEGFEETGADDDGR
jgi:hypothetical protein